MGVSIGESVIEEIKSRIDLADLIASYGVAVHQSGVNAKACCPFHNEKTPSFMINVAKGLYHCFGCGESGNAITFVQKQEGLTFLEAVTKLAERCGVKIEQKEDPEANLRKRLYALMAELAEFYHRCLLRTREAEPARAYLRERALDGDPAEDFLIGYAPRGAAAIFTWAEKHGYTAAELEAAGVTLPPRDAVDTGYHRFGGRLMFTIRDKAGRVVAFSGRQLVADKHSGKYVNSPETPIFKKSRVLFGFDRAASNIAKAPHREAIVCEGQIDTIRLHLSGFPVAVASQGTAFTDEHARMLKRVADQVALVYDDDAAGHKATIKVAGMMLSLEVPVRVVRLPDGDDPDSFLRKKGAEAFQALLDDAESIISFQVRAERAKERNPGSIDAVNRIAKAIVATLAQCASPVLRATMTDEASRLLGIPVVALREETERARTHQASLPRKMSGASSPDDAEMPPVEDAAMEDVPNAGEDAHAAIPPPEIEIELMRFLLANEHEAKLDGPVGEFLGTGVLSHEFTRRFVEAWRSGIVTGTDAIAAFVGGLGAVECAWYDSLLVGRERYGLCTQDATATLHEMIRALWRQELLRRRGELNAHGTQDEARLRLRLSADLQDLKRKSWHDVKETIRRHMKGE